MFIYFRNPASRYIFFYRNIFHLLSFALRVIKTAFKRVDHAAPFARDGKHIQTPKRSNDSRRPDCTPGVYELDRREFPASFSRRIHPVAAPVAGKWDGDFILIIERTVYRSPQLLGAPAPPTLRPLHRGRGREPARVTARGSIHSIDPSSSGSIDVTLTNVVARKYYR